MFEGISIMSVLTLIFGGGGLIAGIISLYHAKSQKNTMDAETFKKFFDESEERYRGEFERYSKELERAKQEREETKKIRNEYISNTDKKIEELNRKMDAMQKKNTIKVRAINSAYRCNLPANIRECPVLKTLDEQLEKNEDSELSTNK